MRFSSLLVIAALIAPLSEGPALAGAPRGQPRIPARLLRCEVGRITNIDPARNQTLVDFVREGRFAPGRRPILLMIRRRSIRKFGSWWILPRYSPP